MLEQPATVAALVLVAHFFVYSLLGWVLEVVYCTVKTGKVVNRGFLAGPYCPIYGFGAVAMIHVLSPLTANPALIFVGTAVIASALELIGGWILERAFHHRWWDYTDQPFNLGGYICLSMSLAWGCAGLLLIKVLHPSIGRLVALTPPLALAISVGILALIMVIDLAASVQAALKLNHQLKGLAAASTLIRSGSNDLSARIGDGALDAAGRIENLKSTSRLLRAFPHLRSIDHPAELLKLRQRAEAFMASRGAINS